MFVNRWSPYFAWGCFSDFFWNDGSRFDFIKRAVEGVRLARQRGRGRRACGIEKIPFPGPLFRSQKNLHLP